MADPNGNPENGQNAESGSGIDQNQAAEQQVIMSRRIQIDRAIDKRNPDINQRTQEIQRLSNLNDSLLAELDADEAAVGASLEQPDPNADQDNSVRGRALQVSFGLEKLLSIYKDDPFERSETRNEASQKVLELIVRAVIRRPSILGNMLLFKIVKKAIMGEITNPLQVLTDAEYRRYIRTEPHDSEQVLKVLATAARDLSMPPDEIAVFEQTYQPNVQDQSQQQRQAESDAEAARQRALREQRGFGNMDVFDRIQQDLIRSPDREAERLEISPFLESLKSRKSFQDHMQTRIDRLTQTRKPGSRENYTFEEARVEASKEIQRAIIYLISRFFYEIYTTSPESRFQEIASRSPNQYYQPSPESQYQSFLQKMQQLVAGGEGTDDFTESSIYAGLVPKKDHTYSHAMRQDMATTIPKVGFTQMNQLEMVQQMISIAEREHGYYKFGTDFRYLNNAPGAISENSSYFRQLEQFAKEALQSGMVDEMNSMEYNELVNAAIMQIGPYYKARLAETNWQTSDDMYRDLFNIQSAIDRDVFDSFVETYKKKGYSEILLRRCFFHAATMLGGRDFFFDDLRTQMDLPVTVHGKPTFRGPHALMRQGGFGVMPLSEELFDYVGDLTNSGEAALCADPDHAPTPYDIQEEIERKKIEYHQAFQFGDAAWTNGKSAIAQYGGNICGAGSIDRLDGWRVSYSYRGWLRPELDERTGFETLRLQNPDESLLARSWKKIENIGITELKNFTGTFLFTDTQLTLVKEGDPATTDKFKHLFGFLYDRYYYDDSVGKAFLNGEDRNGFVQRMMELARSQDNGALKKEMYHILTVLSFERMPIEFLTWEKPNMTQNGVTMLSEVREEFVTTRSDDNPDENRRQNDQFKMSVNDLIFVQQQARMKTIEEMETIRLNSTHDQYNIYGDYDETFSQAYSVVNEESIRQHLLGKYISTEQQEQLNITSYTDLVGRTEPEAVRARESIDRAVRLYQLTREKVQQAPTHNTKIDQYQPDLLSEEQNQEAKRSMRGKLRRKEENMTHRLDTFSQAWQDKVLIEPKDSARSFTRMSETGPDTVARAADWAASTVEVVRKAMSIDIRSACKKAALQRDYEPLYEFIREVKNQVEMADGDVADNIVVPILTRRIINTFKKDEKGSTHFTKVPVLSELRDSIAKRPDSVSQLYTQQEDGQFGWSWDTDDTFNFIQGLAGKTSGGLMTAEQKKQAILYGKTTFYDRLVKKYVPVGLIGIAALVAFTIKVAMDDQKK